MKQQENDIKYDDFTIKTFYDDNRTAFCYIIFVVDENGKWHRKRSMMGYKNTEDALSKAKDYINKFKSNIAEENIKPTFSKPITPMGKNFEKSFNKTMDSVGINLNEIDGKLNEADYKLKKKIFNLSRMENLVFKSPYLTRIYDNLMGIKPGQTSTSKEVKDYKSARWGYHANETVLNIIFNNYILNSAKYLQLYKMATPTKKKRRDRAGIQALKRDAEEQIAKADEKKMKKLDEDMWDDMLNAPIVDSDEDMEDPDYLGKSLDSEDTNPSTTDKVLNKIATTYDSAVDRFKNIMSKRKVNETTSAGSAGGDAGYVGYAGPAAWSSKGDLIKGTKATGDNKNVGGKSTAGVMRRPIFPGGTLIQENSENYLVDPAGFIKYAENLLNENRYDLNNKVINNTAAFNSDTIKNWNKDDMDLENKTLNTGKADEAELQKIEEESMISDNPTSMANDIPETMANTLENPEKATSGIERGTSTANAEAMNEELLFEKIEKELLAFSEHQNKLNKMTEERKSNSQIINDRVTAQNPKNFNKDLSNSGTLSTIEMNKSLQTKKDIEEVGDNAHKYTEELEKEELAKTGGEALKNVGDSANKNGDEIPKRNLTTEEQHEVDMYREGLGDYTYDTINDRFKDRMKKDMGDKLYKDREEKIEIRANRNLYNKAEQPVVDKKEIDPKYKDNLSETLITGRYKDSLGRSHIIDFNFKEANIAESVDNTWSEIHFDGLGNSYANKLNPDSSKLEINESIITNLNTNKYYINENKQLYLVKNNNMLTESEEKKVIVESNEMKRMKKLLDYKPSTLMDNRLSRKI